MTKNIPLIYFEESAESLHIITNAQLNKKKISLDKLKQVLNFNFNKIALLDRDGVIVEKMKKGHYLTSLSDIKLIDGAIEAIDFLNKRDIPSIIVTNQQGIGKRVFTIDEFINISRRIEDMLSLNGVHLDGLFFCPHLENSCSCRKPSSLMLKTAVEVFGNTECKPVMFGDSVSDIEAAIKLEIEAAFINTSHDELANSQNSIKTRYPEIYHNNLFKNIYDAVCVKFTEKK